MCTHMILASFFTSNLKVIEAMKGDKIPIALNHTIYTCILYHVCIHIIHHFPHVL